ncbi:DUF4031 domain-containing protein [Brucella anthropi]|uniref:DUF4031 domain-containing protein n=1 Tax=Brucella anthropi (strain ATCC 49188 / DSM 6882 / CCUG 24695 / JCM 21032 / LMG 3331 / NBRC 15819 / NCTC 12168 / Alc 37) TaxID=439375 RepID=A6X1D8_BRUA4|nr:DUF4031 domain-containing protein [Brucella anthropi]ABS15042.1 hypothetical protein Oant_2328 [Brucella anthropi ATCC 49188]NKC48524.1 DUF4031 domain-containing protein [Brucella anthropi ATCC 49188]QQC26532.1 DUF4031 domain-containing protein [Brucella anthropi]SUA62529.1 Uncharacterised protein [Brucella anthropi]
MSVFVDDMAAAFGNMLMCHMWADTDEELLTMADMIGVKRKWIQGHPTLSFGKHRNASWVHFDIAKSKRALAIKLGALETDRFGPLEYTAKLLIATGDPKRVEIGNRKLAMVAVCRERRQKNGGALL